MKTVRITVPGEMPGMNEIIAAAKSHPMAYAEMKETYTDVVAYAALGRPRVKPAVVRCHWFAKNRRRDPDNIEAGIKFVLDGLVAARILPGDGWRHIAGIEHDFTVDRKNPRIEVEVKEVSGGASR